jgi:hypothetical protein
LRRSIQSWSNAPGFSGTRSRGISPVGVIPDEKIPLRTSNGSEAFPTLNPGKPAFSLTFAWINFLAGDCGGREVTRVPTATAARHPAAHTSSLGNAQAQRLTFGTLTARDHLLVSRWYGWKLSAKPVLLTIMPAPVVPRAFFTEQPASTSRECQQRAAECLRLVRTVVDSTNKALLLEMAVAWIKLAEQKKVNGE